LTSMPQIGIYESPEINAFATGPSRHRSLVAVSSGLLLNLSEEEVEGVLAHEVAHIANGDMVTMSLLQGVINAFVMFFARIGAHLVHQLMNRNSNNSSRGFLYFGLVWVFEVVLMIFGTMIVCWFSRHREFRADAGGARLTSSETIIKALEAVGKN